DLDLEALRAFDHPVYFALGGRSNPDFFACMAQRLSAIFPDFTLETFSERHHFDPPHRLEPERLANALLAIWQRGESAPREHEERNRGVEAARRGERQEVEQFVIAKHAWGGVGPASYVHDRAPCIEQASGDDQQDAAERQLEELRDSRYRHPPERE